MAAALERREPAHAGGQRHRNPGRNTSHLGRGLASHDFSLSSQPQAPAPNEDDVDVQFFKEDGSSFGDAAPQSDFTVVTQASDANFWSMLHMRGFLDGMDDAAQETQAKGIWDQATAQMPEFDALKSTPFDRSL